MRRLPDPNAGRRKKEPEGVDGSERRRQTSARVDSGGVPSAFLSCMSTMHAPTDRAALDALLARIAAGDEQAQAEFFPLVYKTLRLVAGRLMGRPRSQTLQPTALVHEAWIRLFGDEQAAFSDREHFMRCASLAMRQILVDQARRRRAAKRPPRDRRVDLDLALVAFESEVEVSVLDLDAALSALADEDAELAAFVQIRVFGGFTVEEAAAAMKLSANQGKVAWRTAKAFLRTRLEP